MQYNYSTILAVGSGGFLGANLRYYVGSVVAKYNPSDIPIATLSVNLIGSLLIGMLVALFVTYTPYENIKLFLVTGFLGALTTYSTFAIESYFLLNKSLYLGISNILLNLVGTIVCASIGYKAIIYLLK